MANSNIDESVQVAANENNPEIKYIHNCAMIAAARSAGVTDELKPILSKARQARVKEESAAFPTILLLNFPLEDLAVDLCPDSYPRMMIFDIL